MLLEAERGCTIAANDGSKSGMEYCSSLYVQASGCMLAVALNVVPAGWLLLGRSAKPPVTYYSLVHLKILLAEHGWPYVKMTCDGQPDLVQALPVPLVLPLAGGASRAREAGSIRVACVDAATCTSMRPMIGRGRMT